MDIKACYGIVLISIGRTMTLNEIDANEAWSAKYAESHRVYLKEKGVHSELINELLGYDFPEVCRVCAGFDFE